MVDVVNERKRAKDELQLLHVDRMPGPIGGARIGDEPRKPDERNNNARSTGRIGEPVGTERIGTERERIGTERIGAERIGAEPVGTERIGTERIGTTGADEGGTAKDVPATRQVTDEAIPNVSVGRAGSQQLDFEHPPESSYVPAAPRDQSRSLWEYFFGASTYRRGY